MTSPGNRAGRAAAAIWRETDFARDWAAGDSFRDLLDFPRQMAAVIIAGDNPEPGTIVDIGAGPGDFLAVMLEQFPQAPRRLDRRLGAHARPGPGEARAVRRPGRVPHRRHDRPGRRRDPGRRWTSSPPPGPPTTWTGPAWPSFYTAAGKLLAPGGWLVNLDHIGPAGPGDTWDQRLRAARKQFGVRPTGPSTTTTTR